MPLDVESAMSESAEDFQRLVWPAVSSFAGGGEILLVETHASDDMRRRLDMLAGIDAWQIAGPNGRESMRGLASRVQWRDRPYRTFTIRYSLNSGRETEWHKRIRAMDNPGAGWLSPALTVQAYVSEDRSRLLWAAMVRTSDLFAFARFNPPEPGSCTWVKKAPGGNQFLVVPAEALQRDAKVKIWSAEESQLALPWEAA